jgi:hypothetical protein
MTTSTKIMLRVMQSLKSMTEAGDTNAAMVLPLIDPIEMIDPIGKKPQRTSSPSMTDLLTYCLSPKKDLDNTL